MPQKLLMSFHGVPKRYLLEGCPYHCECHVTGRLLAEALELPEGSWQVTFQSRFGREEWLRPYTDETLKALPGEGVKHVAVIAPGFSADCLETIEELGEENRNYFMEAGGESYHYIPALNDRADHIDALADLVMQHSQGWPEAGMWDAEAQRREREHSAARARALGAER
jgi:ferrochelatase